MSAQILDPTPENIEAAARALRFGQVVGMPTETVYGLAGDVFQPEALGRIYETKERPRFDPLIAHVAVPIDGVECDFAWLSQFKLVDPFGLPEGAREQAERMGIATADYFCGIAQTGEMTREGVMRLLRSLQQGTTELMCHPGYMDAELGNSATRLQGSRQMEVEILTNTEIRKLVASQGIRLIDYGLVASEA